jgi:hypothetical protein
LCGIRGHGSYGNEGGEENKEKGQYTFSDQFGFIILMRRPNHLRPKRILIRMGKVNLNLYLLVIQILNALSV